jgi:hypothetical protein
LPLDVSGSSQPPTAPPIPAEMQLTTSSATFGSGSSSQSPSVDPASSPAAAVFSDASSAAQQMDLTVAPGSCCTGKALGGPSLASGDCQLLTAASPPSLETSDPTQSLMIAAVPYDSSDSLPDIEAGDKLATFSDMDPSGLSAPGVVSVIASGQDEALYSEDKHNKLVPTINITHPEVTIVSEPEALGYAETSSSGGLFSVEHAKPVSVQCPVDFTQTPGRGREPSFIQCHLSPAQQSNLVTTTPVNLLYPGSSQLLSVDTTTNVVPTPGRGRVPSFIPLPTTLTSSSQSASVTCQAPVRRQSDPKGKGRIHTSSSPDWAVAPRLPPAADVTELLSAKGNGLVKRPVKTQSKCEYSEEVVIDEMLLKRLRREEGEEGNVPDKVRKLVKKRSQRLRARSRVEAADVRFNIGIRG